MKLTVFCCHNCLYGDADPRAVGKAGSRSADKIEVACSSRVEAIQILKAIETGADGVLVVACPESDCKLIEGSARAGKRVDFAKRLLAETGYEPERVMIKRPARPAAAQLESLVREAEAALGELGAPPPK
jgi:coenzyme F420-reducing hydrogenase delta subunit